MFWSYYLGYLMKTFLFDTGNGNDDWASLWEPSAYGLVNAVNVNFKGYEDPNHKMGGWFIKPLADSDSCVSNSSCQADKLFQIPQLTAADTVFLLLHGNAKNRGASHRLAAYKTFQSLGFYTLTIDYRGYGDSTKIDFDNLSEASVVEDASIAVRELRKRLGKDFNLVLYGHSMGSGISTHVAANMQDEGVVVNGVILDSPFFSFKQALLKTPLSRVLSSVLFLETVLSHNGLEFDSSGWLNKLKCPVRILHADVDHVIPISESEALLRVAKESGKTNIEMIRFTEEGLGHIGISTTKGFQEQIADFAQLASST